MADEDEKLADLPRGGHGLLASPGTLPPIRPRSPL